MLLGAALASEKGVSDAMISPSLKTAGWAEVAEQGSNRLILPIIRIHEMLRSPHRSLISSAGSFAGEAKF